MNAPNLNYAWSQALFDELVRGGVRHVVVCPGSRSSPLAVTAAETKALRTWSIIDERSAAFFALGLARATSLPVALVATSGSAGAHFLPAAIEASLSHVPLIFLTADRPWELQGFGAPQTIPQQELYGRFARRFDELPVPEASDACFAHLRSVVARAVHESQSSPPAPVHLNVPFREPLAPTDAAFANVGTTALRGRPNGAPYLSFSGGSRPRSPDAAEVRALVQRLSKLDRGVIVCGPRAIADGFGPAVHALARALDWPVLAEATSQARYGFDGEAVVHYDALLQHMPFAFAQRPAFVLRFGGGLTSKRLFQWLDGCGAETLLVSDHGAVNDPAHVAASLIQGNATALCTALTEQLPARSGGTWRASWLEADRRVRAIYEAELSSHSRVNEPLIARTVAAQWPAGGKLFVSSSMAIRELDSYSSPDRAELRVLCNRGANGIDGIVSSALGLAAADDRPTALLTGDLAFLHDLGGLLTAKRHGLNLTVVVVNNDGGGIFSFLPIAQTTPHFEALFGTAHGVDLAHAARLFGATHHLPATASELTDAITRAREGGLHLIEVKVRRDDNPVVHRALAEKTRAALEQGGFR